MKRVFILLIILIISINTQVLVPPCRDSRIKCCGTRTNVTRAGFKGKEIDVMTGKIIFKINCLAIAHFASGWGDRKGPNKQPDGSLDHGVFQLNSYLWCSANGFQKDCCCPGMYLL
jgi:hypothetical protein